jgi:hypothetical protein
MGKRLMLFCVLAVGAGLAIWTCSKKSNPVSGGTAPVITTQPASQTVTEGSSVSFTVVATGDPAPSYQWRKDGVNIANATSSTYSIASATPSDAGSYTVVVSNSQGTVTSNTATLTVNAAQQGWTATYEISGDLITIHFPADTYTSTYCDYSADTLVTDVYIDSAYTETDTFSLSGNTLTVWGPGPDTTIVFTRVGSGSGIQGTWTTTMYGATVTLVITATTLTMTESDISYCVADDFMTYYPYMYDTAYFAITATKLSCTQVRLTGDTTGEQVTITWNSNGDMTYTSNRTGSPYYHTAYTYYANPTTCPNNYEPDWFWSYPDGFLTTNMKGIGKKAVAPSAPVLLDMQKKMMLLKLKHKHLL